MVACRFTVPPEQLRLLQTNCRLTTKASFLSSSVACCLRRPAEQTPCCNGIQQGQKLKLSAPTPGARLRLARRPTHHNKRAYSARAQITYGPLNVWPVSGPRLAGDSQSPTTIKRGRMTVPYFDLKLQYAALRDEILQAVDRVCAGASFVLGEEVAKFEEKFAA